MTITDNTQTTTAPTRSRTGLAIIAAAIGTVAAAGAVVWSFTAPANAADTGTTQTVQTQTTDQSRFGTEGATADDGNGAMDGAGAFGTEGATADDGNGAVDGAAFGTEGATADDGNGALDGATS
ncbi:hypothetical protein GCM10025865_24450 [Paraoerskovia sediminicola]|uniref:Uncharacterized protein n=1 Tax=Paraoerskovia sediminicola TaxID=1138587 RepID=A0ABM8G4W5_9CELL|nr:hypothetical protein [Paraoerskovia sediminicola]BDZ43146.1 hypothetical protein GCM10025865_24450 [Paraoerskovia sediminicola]